MASLEESLTAVRAALGEQKFFDGVQLLNSVFEAHEGRLKVALPDLPPFEPLDSLRTCEAWLEKVAPALSDGMKIELAQMYALRADLLEGLGATKRAVADISAALQLLPNEPIMAARKQALELVLSGGAGAPASGDDAKVPVTIITGFLGAGKTTLLNHILSAQHGRRIAIIENEFGEVGIDDALLAVNSNVMEENIVEMNNGCICCTVRGDLIVGLKKLHKQTAGKGKPLDAIIIETTGLADPSPVAQTFFADDFVQSKMRLDGILTVADAMHVVEHLKEEKPEGIINEAVQQIAFADRIMLNKVDLVSPEYLAEVEDEIRTINKNAAIRQTQNSRVDLDFIMGIKAFSLDKVLEQVDTDFLEEVEHGHDHGGHGAEPAAHGGHGGHGGHGDGHAEAGHGGHGDGHGDGHGEGHGAEHGGHSGHSGHEDCHESGCQHESHGRKKKHVHDYRVTSVGLIREHEVAKDRLDNFLMWLMREQGPDLYRSKGVLAVQGQPNKFVFQAVHMQFGDSLKEPWKEGEKRICKMVFIGKNLNRELLNSKFDECLVR